MDRNSECMDVDNDAFSRESMEFFKPIAGPSRLWNNSTKNAQNFNILIVGATSTGITLCNKLITSKIKSVTLLCEYETEQEDVDSLFTLSRFDTTSKDNIRDLRISNIDVTFTAENASLIEKQVSYFLQYDVIIMTSISSRKVIYLDDLCRKHNIKFYYAGTFGKFGFSLHNVVCFDIMNVYMCPLKDTSYAQKEKHYCYIIFNVLHRFMDTYHRTPKYAEDAYNLKNICYRALEKCGVPLDYLPERYLENCYEYHQLSCAIVTDYLYCSITNNLYDDSDVCIKFFDQITNNEIFCDLSDFIQQKLQINAPMTVDGMYDDDEFY